MAAFTVSLAACSGTSDEDMVASNDETADTNVDSTGEASSSSKLYGSDILKTAVSNYATVAVPTPQPTYMGKGSGIGEACMRDPSAIPQSGGLFCTGPIAYQSLAPMSRAMRNTGTNTCSGGATSPNTTTGCCPNERTNVIGLDGINLYVRTTNPNTNLSKASIKLQYAGNGDGNTLVFPSGCPTTLVFAKRYRPNDSSGTTYMFKSLVGIADTRDFHSFCPGVFSVNDSASPTVTPTIDVWSRSGVKTTTNATMCAIGDSATVCLGKIAGADPTAVVYTGNPAQNANNRKLTVDNIASNPTTIRNLLTNTAPVYPLARRLYLNENTVLPSRTEEKNFYNSIYGSPAGKASFESRLTADSFVACSAAGPLRCGVGLCGGVNDGRGTAVVINGVDVACKSTLRCTR
jgi:phosphate transport system substrate-binding protein